jgi:homoaconitase/3-isopropylmalate dehydratase large subunit
MHSVDDMERRGIKVSKAYIVSCTNSRVQDLSAAANVLRVRHAPTTSTTRTRTRTRTGVVLNRR